MHLLHIHHTPLQSGPFVCWLDARAAATNGEQKWMSKKKKCSLKTTQNKSENITIYGKERVLLLISALIVIVVVEEFAIC